MAAAVEKDTRVALAGLGKMGVAIAERILDAGYPLAVHNRTPERAQPLAARGATVLASAADALAQADVCITMLSDDTALEAVALETPGVLSGARPGTVLVDMSTVSVAVSERVADAAAEAGVEYLRAPVSGNPTVVRGGTLTIVVSGPEHVAQRVEPLLKAIGPTVFYVGEDERARAVKLVLQVMVGGIVELLGEAVVLGESAGVDRARLLEVLCNSAVAAPLVKYKSEPLLRDDFSATFTTTMMLKDVELILELARERGVVLPFTNQLRTLLEETAESGYADADFMALYARLRHVAAGESIATASTSPASMSTGTR
jgi:3-hydroxyisobutyrate dehydrogenase-like beta-hydroxyacid dehydrogenase